MGRYNSYGMNVDDVIKMATESIMSEFGVGKTKARAVLAEAILDLYYNAIMNRCRYIIDHGFFDKKE